MSLVGQIHVKWQGRRCAKAASTFPDMVPRPHLLLPLAALSLLLAAASASQQDGAVAEVLPHRKHKPRSLPSLFSRSIRLLLCALPSTSTSRCQETRTTLQTPPPSRTTAASAPAPSAFFILIRPVSLALGFRTKRSGTWTSSSGRWSTPATCKR